MAYPNNFLKISWGGSIYGDKDIWTNAINFGVPGGDVNFDLLDATVAFATLPTLVANWFESAEAHISRHVTLEWLKIAFINAEGVYDRDPLIWEYEPFLIGNETGNTAPQLTTAVSFNTDVRRGAGRFGRIYPPLAAVIGPNGTTLPATAEEMRDAAAQLVGNAQLSLSILGVANIRAIVASQKTAQHNPVTGIRVGLVVDTQRRRRNAFPELYTDTVGPQITPGP